MSAPFLRGKTYVLYVPTTKGLLQKSTGTKSREMAKKIAAFVDTLRDEGKFDLLDEVGAGRITLRNLYNLKVEGKIDERRHELRSPPVESFIESWIKVQSSNGLSPASAKLYVQRMRRLLPAGTFAHQLTPGNVVKWLAEIPGTPGTRRQYLNELSSLCVFLVGQEVLADNPVARRDLVKRPKKNASRTRWEREDVDRGITDRLSGAMRIAALVCVGTGADRSTVWHMTVGDFALLPEGVQPDPARELEHRVNLPGSKTVGRNRKGIRIEPWIVPALRTWIAGKESTTPLVDGVKPATLSDQWKAAAKAEGKAGYTLKDARHSYGCRALLAGYSLWEVSKWLGHQSIATTADVYLKFDYEVARLVRRTFSSRASDTD
jgi:integrase